MTIELREDVAYVLLDKINHHQAAPTDSEGLVVATGDFTGRHVSVTDLLAHIDYLNQKGYVEANFSGDAYGDKGPNPLPDSIHLTAVQLTPKGQELLANMQQNPPQALQTGPRVPITTADMPFLQKVMLKGNLEDLYDARDLAEVVFRTMRDLMPTEAADRVAAELHEQALPTKQKALQAEVADLWQDTNPLVRFLSRLRSPLEFDAELFIRRVRQEGGLPRRTNAATAIRAVFAATKEELSEERIQEIATFLPGKVQRLWQTA